MAITLEEQFESRQNTANSTGYDAVRVFHSTDAQGDPDYAIANLPDGIGAAHPELALCYLKTVDATGTGGFDPDTGDEVIKVTYNYGPPERRPSNQNDEIWEYDMNSQTTHINRVKNDGGGTPLQWIYDADNLNGTQGLLSAIEPDENGNIIGVDAYRPFGALRVTKYYNATTVDKTFRQTIYDLQGKTNDAAWPPSPDNDWAANEVLFLGANIRYNLTDNEAVVTYNFLFGPTNPAETFEVWANDFYLTAETVTVNVAARKPFEYIWALMETHEVPDSQSGVVSDSEIQTWPRRIGVARIYEEGDFSTLGLVGPS
jgi:hypothetical protein